METYTVKEISRLLRVSTTQVYNLLRNRSLGHMRVGKKILITKEALEAFIKANTIPAHKNHLSRGA